MYSSNAIEANVAPQRQAVDRTGDPFSDLTAPLPGDHTRGATSKPTIVVPAIQRESHFFSASELYGKPVPPREWLVDGLIPHKNVTLFSGDGGTGKSLVALQLAVAVVIGRSWIGKSVTSGRTIYLSAEDDDDEIHRRLADIVTAEALTLADLGNLVIRSLAGEDALLAVETAVSLAHSTLFDELDRAASVDPVRLIVLDTLADLYPANENERAKVRQFIGILRGLALRRNCAVLLLGHPSLSGLMSGAGTAGSTAWNNSVRSRLYLERVEDGGYEPDPDRRKLTTKKANYGRIGGEIAMRWTDGIFIAEQQPQGLDAMAQNAKAERVFLKLLRQFKEEGRTVNHASGQNYAPKVFSDHHEREGVHKTAFKAAMNTLLHCKTIRIAKGGKPSRPVSYLEEVVA